MPEYTSGSIHFTGLGNGTDFDTMISQLKKIELMPAQKLLKWRSDWLQRLDAFGQVRTELENLSAVINEMNSVEKFLVKNAKSSNESVLSATSDSKAIEGTYRIEVGQLATNAQLGLETGLADKLAIVNNSGATQNFAYNYKGTTYNVAVPTGTTLEGLKNLINNQSGNPGVKATMMQGTDGMVFQLYSMEQGKNATLDIDSSTTLEGFGKFSVMKTSLADGNSVINTSGANQTLNFKYNGADYGIDVGPGVTLGQLRDFINTNYGSIGISASLVSGANGMDLKLESTDPNAYPPVIDPNSTLTAVTNHSAGWMKLEGKNAQVRINGWPADPSWLELPGNTTSDVIEGVNLTFNSVGPSTLTVSTDKAKIKENVVKFVDAVNSARTLLNTLTKVDENKTITSDKYADSQFEMEKGSILTGNYGIQLIASKLKDMVISKSGGFSYLHQNADGTYSGDVFSSLAQIGIKTDADASSKTFGLLIFETNNDLITLDKALNADPQAVAELFAAKSAGVSDSPKMGVDSTMDSWTKAGEYKVSYEVDAAGEITGATINGKPAKFYNDTKQLFLARDADNPEVNPADGITLNIYDLTPGAHEGTVRIKEGKLTSLKKMIDVDFLDPDNGQGDTVKGTLTILETEYKSIIKNIEKKIEREDERVIKWERLTRLRFARLEAVLKKYDGLTAQLESQIKQLGPDK